MNQFINSKSRINLYLKNEGKNSTPELTFISGEQTCLKSRESGCDKGMCCAGLQCYNGPDSTWARGICVDDDLMITIHELTNKDDDKELGM